MALNTSGAINSIHDAVRQAVGQNSPTALTGAWGINRSPALNQAVQSAIAKSVEDALNTSGAINSIHDAVRQAVGQNSPAALTGAWGIDRSPALNQALQSAIAKTVEDALHTSGTTETLRRATQRAAHTLVTGRIGTNQAVERSIRDAIQATGKINAPDPAVAIQLRRQSEQDAPHSHEREVEAELLNCDFSPKFSNAGSFFEPTETVIASFDDLTASAQSLAEWYPDYDFVWRGQTNADWALHSSLYRALLRSRSIDTSGPSASTSTQMPGEVDMVAAEIAIIREAASWRMADRSPLELFARIQHQGGPTRLLDVTRNPHIAAWFAVEDFRESSCDARLFAIAIAKGRESTRSLPPTLTDPTGGSSSPFWHYSSMSDLQEAEWGTGWRRRVWVPPTYDPRIGAQNAAFLLEGTPRLTHSSLAHWNQIARTDWTAADILASTSINAPFARPNTGKSPRRRTEEIFTYRIKLRAKSHIRDTLSRVYGLSTALLYPDVQGLSRRLLDDTTWLQRPDS